MGEQRDRAVERGTRIGNVLIADLSGAVGRDGHDRISWRTGCGTSPVTSSVAGDVLQALLGDLLGAAEDRIDRGCTDLVRVRANHPAGPVVEEPGEPGERARPVTAQVQGFSSVLTRPFHSALQGKG
ncbi:hypothetical protein [Streptomyces sp. NPDC059092]|uniref:hypothetical protein n=1 Tax=Streptomyces sp. NPDC059092 TaxID=3346725 RepID=UPI00367B7264